MAGEKNIEQIVAQMLEPIMEENSCELVDVEFVKEGPNWYLRAVSYTHLRRISLLNLNADWAIPERTESIWLSSFRG